MKKDVFDELIVVKRSGQRVNFNSYKIVVAIKSSFDTFKDKYNEQNINEVYENVLKIIEKDYGTRKTINVEDIQDIIESELKRQKYSDVYEEFSEYRQKRADSRKIFSVKQQHKFAIAMEKINDDNLLDPDKQFKASEIIDRFGNTVLEEYVKSYLIDNKYLRSFEEGNIYINSLENSSLGKVEDTNILLENEFDNLYLLTNYLLSLQKEISGEIHICEFNKELNKYYMKYLKQIFINYLENNLNIAGYKNYINVSSIVKIIEKSEVNFLDNILPQALNDNVINIFRETYNKALFETNKLIEKELNYMLIKLDESEHCYSFGLSNLDSLSNLILKIMNKLKRLDYVKFIYKVNNKESNFEELFESIKDNKNILISADEFEKEYFSNGISIYDNYNDDNYSPGRMIISKTSINMARLAMTCKSMECFYDKLGNILELVKNELLMMFEMIGNKTKDNYEVLFDNNIMYDEKLETGGKIRKVIKNSNLLIGLVGLKECIDIIAKDEDEQFSLLNDILDYLNKLCDEFHQDTKLNFYIYEPSTDKSRKYFMALDKSIYGKRKNITDKDKYQLISEGKNYKNDYERLNIISNKINGGFLIRTEIKDNITYKKFIYLIEELIDNKVRLIEFIRSTT